MRLSLRRRAAVLLLTAAALAGTSACFGSFNLTRKVYGFNKDVSKDKFVRELVFLGMVIVPIYQVGALIDAVVANTVEFWTGTNPIDMASRIRVDSTTSVVRVWFVNNGVRTMTLKTFKLDTLVDATTIQYVPGADRMTFKTVFADGRIVIKVVAMDADGNTFVYAGDADQQRRSVKAGY